MFIPFTKAYCSYAYVYMCRDLNCIIVSPETLYVYTHRRLKTQRSWRCFEDSGKRNLDKTHTHNHSHGTNIEKERFEISIASPP